MKKTKFKKMKLSLIVIKNYNCGVIRVKFDVDLYSFKSRDTYLIDPKNAKIVNENEWNIIINEIIKNYEDYNKKMQNLKEKKINSKKGCRKREKIKKYFSEDESD